MTCSFGFIDSRVGDYQTLIAGLGSDAARVLIDADRDGIDQMRSALAGCGGLEVLGRPSTAHRL
jgi:hypothetical protein